MNSVATFQNTESLTAFTPVAALVVAALAFLVSLTTLILSIRNRRLDLDRQKINDRRIRVWGILCSDAGSRSVEALDQTDNKTVNRLNFLKRTATQLDQAGAPELATKLRAVIENATWPTPDIAATNARRAFFDGVKGFMG